MTYKKTLEIDDEHYDLTKEVLINNGSKVYEHKLGSRKTLISNDEICGFTKMNNQLKLSENITDRKFYSFLGLFTKTLYNEIKQNDSLLLLKIEFNGSSRDKNRSSWDSIKSKTTFYNLDLSSAYWQMAYRLGYISKKLFDQYIYNDDYKQAKRYCISFLARENEMNYLDGREIDKIVCDISCLNNIYMNIRHELYSVINMIKDQFDDWIEYNIDGISVVESDLEKAINLMNQQGLIYKVNQCLKIDKNEYYFKGKIRKF